MNFLRGSNVHQIICWLLLVTPGVLAPAPAHSASLTLADQTAGPGQTIFATISYSSEGQNVSGLQFDLTWDPALSIRVLAGAQVGSAAKNLYSASVGSQGLRILVLGANQTVLNDGDLLRLVISLLPNIAPGPVSIGITNASATDAYGGAVALKATGATLTVQSGLTAAAFAPAGVLSGASLMPGPVSPGEVLTVLGGPDLAATSAVLFNGTAAPLLYAGPGQVNTIAPMGLDPTTNVTLELQTPQTSLGSVSLPASPFSPGIFTMDASGVGAGVVLNEDYTINSPANPARVGSIIILYGTGFGPVTPAVPDGQAASGAASTSNPVTASVAGVPATVMYAGAAPGIIAGVEQINLQIPGGVPSNPAAPVVFTVGQATSQAGVMVAVQ